jgi:hypothetical protein
MSLGGLRKRHHFGHMRAQHADATSRTASSSWSRLALVMPDIVAALKMMRAGLMAMSSRVSWPMTR